MALSVRIGIVNAMKGKNYKVFDDKKVKKKKVEKKKTKEKLVREREAELNYIREMFK